MKISRRSAIVGLSAVSSSIFLKIGTPAFAREWKEGTLPPIPEEYQSISDQDPMNDQFGERLTQTGTAKASDAEVSIAKEIINSMNFSEKPIDVAAYFLDIANGDIGAKEWRSYTRAWPKDAPANPLILEFFTATKTKPEGDTTAWCAAFVNWCILRSSIYKNNEKLRTNSASSGSFRNWGNTIVQFDPSDRSESLRNSDPRIGDIVVFNQTKSNGDPHPFKGHVGFFLDMDKKRIRVLGGNQFEGKPVVHAINIKWIPKDGFLKAHSIRSAGEFH